MPPKPHGFPRLCRLRKRTLRFHYGRDPEPMEMLAALTGGSLHSKDNGGSSATSLHLEVPGEAASSEDEDSQSFFSVPRELVESQPTTRPQRGGLYHCEFCPYFTRYLHHLTRHKKKHTGERPFCCSVCEMAFAEIDTLQTHMRTHTGEKPYRCEVCQKSFVKNSRLVIHKRVHTGEKPYQCGICEKTFSDQSNFLTHKRTHSGERPYKCEACGEAFGSKTHLGRHRKRMHK
ncbi:zinc finger protein 7-like isoform X1 [Ixodes scapularis]|uniref:zinc finger protein 7-like isoform X1 n=2 Tax=Ixodes scapularis TaxID=6945 RepID=UPI001C389057|nr:zinc finger protein 7-like isoform X1 [Ixodes scapularis]XP_042149146.1 zinc finger protein 7-like isoform X1 [Ixodes scapularis]